MPSFTAQVPNLHAVGPVVQLRVSIGSAVETALRASGADGVLSGRYGIAEQHLGQRIVRAHLQRPKDDGWETIGTCTWATLLGFIPWRRTTKVLQNLPATP